MTRILLALQACWRILVDAEFGRRVAQLLSNESASPSIGPTPTSPPTKVDSPAQRQPAAVVLPQRSEALTLLATLQREARLVDFLKEPIGEYTDAQVGAAVRDIHRDAAAVLDRLFNVRPIETHAEGDEIQVAAQADQYRLIGTVRGSAPHRGRLVHHGWEAAQCAMPVWSGSSVASRVIAPVEVELLA